MDLKESKMSSSALLDCGSQRGFNEKFLLKPKGVTEKVARSHVLERVQSFLPQMAEANEQLQRQIEETSPENVDIENVDDAPQVIHMEVALVELDTSDSDEEEEMQDMDSDCDSDDDQVTEENLKLPGDRRGKPHIQVLQEK